MKYTIHGFNQYISVEFGLDADDLLILRYFVDFKDSGSMVSEAIDGETYYWIKYEGILKELPVLKMKKDSVYRRLKKMCEVGVLKHKTIKRNGTYSFYGLGPKYIQLISDLNPKGTEINPEGVRKNIREGTDLNPDQKINLLNNPSTKNISSSCNKELPNKEVYQCFEQCGFGFLNATLIEMIDADVEIHSKEWVMDAFKEAVRQGKYKLSYAEGILRRWKADGRDSKPEKEAKGSGVNKRSNKQSYTAGPSKETLRLEQIAREKGLLKDGEIQDTECDF